MGERKGGVGGGGGGSEEENEESYGYEVGGDGRCGHGGSGLELNLGGD